MKAARLRGRRVTVMGLGLFGGGAGVARYLARGGARVTVTDLRDRAQLESALEGLAGLEIELALGGHHKALFTDAELVVANPAVPRDNRWLALARAKGVPITSEAALFLDASPARVVAITGTQGKSSTAHFLAQLCEALGQRVFLGGNIGRSLLDDLEALDERSLCVLELSSYQLEGLPDECERRGKESAIEIGVIVNVLADHLERHGTQAAYARAKRRLIELVQPGGVLLAHPSALMGLEPADESALEGLRLPECKQQGPVLEAPLEMAVEELEHLPDFQRVNLRFALAAALALGLEPEALAGAVAHLRGMPHRLERLAPVDGHPIHDNGVSTTPDSTASALRALGKVGVLLAGGRPKMGLELAGLTRATRDHARAVVLFGELAELWHGELESAGLPVRCAPDLARGVELAFDALRPGEALLFSPAAASFDAWPNWVARAEAFRRFLARS